MTYKPDIMLYHANCADGFGAAWAAWMRWRDEVQYVPVAYGQSAPDVTGKHVLIGDFSFKADVLREMGRAAKSIIVLDHHKTAEADLAEWAVDDVSGEFWGRRPSQCGWLWRAIAMSDANHHAPNKCRRCDNETRFPSLCGACIGDDMDFYEGDCWNCGGEGYVYGCSWDWQCDTYDPGEGSCLCTRRCDFCNPAPRNPELDAVLSEALAKTKDEAP